MEDLGDAVARQMVQETIPKRSWNKFLSKLKKPRGWREQWLALSVAEQTVTLHNYQKALEDDAEHGTKTEELAYWRALRDQLHAFKHSRRDRSRSRASSQARSLLF